MKTISDMLKCIKCTHVMNILFFFILIHYSIAYIAIYKKRPQTEGKEAIVIFYCCFTVVPPYLHSVLFLLPPPIFLFL